MNFLPIVERELRVISRRPWMYWVRLFFGSAGIVAALIEIYEESSNPAARGEAMLWLMSVVTLGLAVFFGCLLTADCISSEKREDTLGLLFLTNLKGYDVVFGKIATHAITTACGLLAVFPVFFLPILAGGVTWAETIRVLLAIAVSFLFALTLGVWISARSRDARNAMMVALTALLLIISLPLLWVVILDELLRVRVSLIGVPQLSPGMLLFYARDAWFASPNGSAVYWSSMVLFATATVVLAALASRSLPKAWRHEGLPVMMAEAGQRWRFWRAVGQVARRPRWSFNLPNPFQNLFLYRLKEFIWGKRFRQLLIFFFLVLVAFSVADDDPLAFAILVLFVMHAITKFAMAFDAGRALSEDKRSSALELLLTAPASDRAIPEGLAAAFRARYRPQVWRLMILTAVWQVAAMLNPKLRGDDLFLISSFVWGPVIWTWSDYRTIAWVGMEHALRQNTHLKGMLRTIGTMIVPWAPFFFVIFCLAESHTSEEAAGTVTWCWAIGASVYQSYRVAKRRARLLRDFRMVATGSTDLVERSESAFRRVLEIFPKGSGAQAAVQWLCAFGARR